ncbi:MAG: ribosome biogenesis GTP-binding protein YihA/YsxC [Spirochaetia bacterium]|nr:ribosome biogenesis GTP-binding protein YihA/YsxC [Spirochaetia bacterium]
MGEDYFFKGASYKSSYPSVQSAPDDSIPIVVFTGRSNSGKSSLISALCRHKNLAHSSGTPGKTRLLNYFSVPFKKFGLEEIYFVDMPGYGYAKLSSSEKKELRMMVDNFLIQKKDIRLMLVVLDARRNLGEEEKNIILYCKEHHVPFLLVRTKWDTLNQKEKAGVIKNWKAERIYDDCAAVSSLKTTGLNQVAEKIIFSVTN